MKLYVKDKNNNTFECIIEAVDLKWNGEMTLRYNIGVRNHQGFNSLHCIYSNEEFNRLYKAI